MSGPVTRMYLACHYENGRVVRERVISAPNRPAARAHATNTTISIDLLTPDDALRLGAAGVVTEVAGNPVNPDKFVDPDQTAIPMKEPAE